MLKWISLVALCLSLGISAAQAQSTSDEKTEITFLGATLARCDMTPDALRFSFAVLDVGATIGDELQLTNVGKLPCELTQIDVSEVAGAPTFEVTREDGTPLAVGDVVAVDEAITVTLVWTGISGGAQHNFSLNWATVVP